MKVSDITPEQQEWLDDRPQVIKDMVATHPPNLLYHLTTTGHRVTIYSYSENGTITVDVSGEYNGLLFERRVFGIRLDDLVECDLPDEGEAIGSLMTPKDVDDNIDVLREMVGVTSN